MEMKDIPPLQLTKDVDDVRGRLEYLKTCEYMDNPLAEALRINYIVHVSLLLTLLDPKE